MNERFYVQFRNNTIAKIWDRSKVTVRKSASAADRKTSEMESGIAVLVCIRKVHSTLAQSFYTHYDG